MPPLYKHQQAFLDENPKKGILAFEAGTGKSRTAIEWAKKWPERHPIIVVTKAIRTKWHDDMALWGYTGKYTILTKEEFRKKKPAPKVNKNLLIVDEAHNFASPLFVPANRSKMSEALYDFISCDPNMPVLLLTANPVRSSPANLHTLLTFRGVDIEWKKWRDAFYHLIHRPYLPRPAWEPKKGWQKRMIPIIEKYCHVALMRDCFDVPLHEYTIACVDLVEDTIESIKKVVQEEWEPMKIWCAEHRLENGIEKLEWIKQFAEGCRKIVVVCRYKDQIAMYAKALEKDRETFVLTGDTNDQGQVIKDAQESPECFLIIQSGIGAGFDLDTFSAMVFASCDWSWVNFSQMHGRINRAHNLHRNRYIYLISGEKDRAILESLQAKQDFDVSKAIKI